MAPIVHPAAVARFEEELRRLLELGMEAEAAELLSFLTQCRVPDRNRRRVWRELAERLGAAEPERLPLRPLFDENDVRQWASAFDPGAPAELPAAALEAIHALPADAFTGSESAPRLIRAIRAWLKRQPRHPFLQFQALAALKRLGAVGWVRLPPAPVGSSGSSRTSGGQQGPRGVRLRIERTPVSPDEHPAVVREVPERVRAVCESDCPALAELAADAWRDFVAIAYASAVYRDIVRDGKRGFTAAWSAALHAAVAASAGWPVSINRLLADYGVGDAMKPAFGRAFRAVRAAFGQSGDGS